MYCQKCGIEAPTKYVAMYQNIGMLVMRLWSSVEGNLCKNCVHSTFWTMTGINMTLGWWGIISLVVTPFFIVNNTVRYLGCLGMESPSPGAAPPQLTDDVMQRLQPHVPEMFGRLNAQEPLERVCQDVAMRTGATPGQVSLYVAALIAQAQQQGQ
ncbi:MAG: hypothetical protein IAF94_12945 [Pirellulaceae bacterium]|nr:hypothetical protein [Pirellulaceae bacterium]